ERVRMANLAQTINVLQAVILTDEEKMLLTPTYHVMTMYNVHQDATWLPVDHNNVDYIHKDQQVPAISIAASKDPTGALHVSLVNIDHSNRHSVEVDIRGADFKKVTGTILSSAKVQDHNTFDNPEKIKPKEFKGFKTSKSGVVVDLPPFSVVVLEIK